jgi:hypothetical protein
MARRSGKAGNRRDRQRKAQRRTLQRPVGPAQPIGGVVSDAVEAVAERRTESSPAPVVSAPRAGRADPRFLVSGPSRLSERAATEYHYVRSDLRNIAVLVVVMAVLLGVAVIARGALGIGPN